MKKYLIGAAATLALLTPATVYAANKIAAKDSTSKEVKTVAKQVAKTSAKASDFNCDDFSSQKEAQTIFEQNGGLGHDIYDLDRDKDGIACEALK